MSTIKQIRTTLGANNYAGWEAFFELYKRGLIKRELMQHGLKNILDTPMLRELHEKAMADKGVIMTPVFTKADYQRLVPLIQSVFSSREQEVFLVDPMFDAMLESHKLLIQQIQGERQRKRS